MASAARILSSSANNPEVYLIIIFDIFTIVEDVIIIINDFYNKKI